MPPNKFNPSNIYSLWQRMNSLWAKILLGRVKFKVGDLVKITKEKVKFAKRYKKTFSTEIFLVAKVGKRVPQPVCELTDLQERPIEGHFYNYELVKFTVLPQTELQLDKIVRTRNKNGIKRHFAKWREYEETFNSWINFTDIKKI